MKKNKLPNIVILLILTTITLVCWISFSAYRVFTKEDTPTVAEELLKDINPKIDSNIITEISQRI